MRTMINKTVMSLMISLMLLPSLVTEAQSWEQMLGARGGSRGSVPLGDVIQGLVQPGFNQPGFGQPGYSQPGFGNQQGQGSCWRPQPTPMPVPVPTPMPAPQPRPVVGHPITSPPTPQAGSSTSVARNKTDVAKAFFKTHQYADAEVRLNEVVTLVPDDTNAWQFRSLVLFAQGKYDAAAADAYDGIKLGNTWTASVLDTIYPSADRYHNQLNQLIASTESQPSMAKHFLLGYHYLVLNQLEKGRLQFALVLEITPEEPVATQLIAAIDARLNPQSTGAETATAAAGQ